MATEQTTKVVQLIAQQAGWVTIADLDDLSADWLSHGEMSAGLASALRSGLLQTNGYQVAVTEFGKTLRTR